MEATLTCQPTTYDPSTTFPFKNLPEELRNLIYPHSLAIPHSDKMVPDLLMVLAADKELFAEAFRVYKRINVRVAKGNIEQFKCMRMKELLKYQHLKVVCDAQETDRNNCITFNDGITFRAHKILLHNNFESITYIVHENLKNWPTILDSVELLLGASRPAVKKVVLRIPHKFDKGCNEGNRTRMMSKVKVSGKSECEWYEEPPRYLVG